MIKNIKNLNINRVQKKSNIKDSLAIRRNKTINTLNLISYNLNNPNPNFIRNDLENPTIPNIKKPSINDLTKNKLLSLKSIRRSSLNDKIIKYMKPIMENVDAEDEISFNGKKFNQKEITKIKENLNNEENNKSKTHSEEEIKIKNQNEDILKKEVINIPKTNRLTDKRFSFGSYKSEQSSEINFCNCKGRKSITSFSSAHSNFRNFSKRPSFVGKPVNEEMLEIIPSRSDSKKSQINALLNRDEIICNSCNGLITKKIKIDSRQHTLKTYLNQSDSISSSSYDSKDISFNLKHNHEINNLASKLKEDIYDKKEDNSSENSENDEKVIIDNLPELEIRYLRFEKMKTPKLSLLLSKNTSMKVIIIVLVLLITEPFFISDQYFESKLDSYTYQIKLMDDYLINNQISKFLSFYEKYINNNTLFNSSKINPYLMIGFNNQSQYCKFFPVNCLNNNTLTILDNGEVIIYEDTDMYLSNRKTESSIVNLTYLFAIYDVSWHIKLGSILNISKILFVAIILWLGSLWFLKDIYRVVVNPLKYITKKINFQQQNIEKLTYSDKNLEKLEILDEENEEKKFMIKHNENNLLISSFVLKNCLLLVKILGNNSIIFYKKSI